MITRGPDEALPNDGGKHVPSTVPGQGPRDLSVDLQRHRDKPDASVTEPPGGYPTTVGTNPNAPADRQVSDEGSGVATSAPGAYSTATQWTGQGGGY